MSTADFDNLAANGVINFDANAYIKGTAPRYVGSPSNANAMPFEQPLGYPGLGAQLPHQPSRDEFNHESPRQMDWKEVLGLGVLGGAVIYAGVQCKNKIKKLFTKKPKVKPTPVTPPPAPVVAKTTAATTKTATSKIGKAKEVVVENFKKGFEWFKNNKAAKISAGIGLGLVALYGIYDVLIKGRARASEEAPVHPNPNQAH